MGGDAYGITTHASFQIFPGINQRYFGLVMCINGPDGLIRHYSLSKGRGIYPVRRIEVFYRYAHTIRTLIGTLINRLIDAIYIHHRKTKLFR